MERCLLCPCNAGTCRLWTSSKQDSLGRLRKYYKCPAQCSFFKWADEVSADELIDVPSCGGCTAGVCRARRVSGRLLFSCRVKEGEGSCGYKVWQDELKTSAVGQVDSSTITLPPSARADSNSTNINLVEEIRPRAYDVSSPVNNTTSQHVIDPLPAMIMAASMPSACCVSPLSDPQVVAQDELVVNPEPESAETSRLSIGIEGCNNTFSKTKTIGNGISKAFAQAAEHLQNELLALLETMDPKDHEAMSREAEITFTALDHLCFNRQHLEKRVKELISCAKLLAKTEQPIPESDSYEKLASKYDSERSKLEEIGSTHYEAVATVVNGRKRLKILKDNISSAKDWVFQAEADLSCFEDELRNMEHQLEQISKDKEVLEGKYLIASKELEDSKKHCERREEAKAAFNRARALLRA